MRKVRINYADDSYIVVDEIHAWEYQNDPDWISTTKIEE